MGGSRALQVLLERWASGQLTGIDLEVLDKHGRTPLALAKENGHEEVARLLTAAGAAH